MLTVLYRNSLKIKKLGAFSTFEKYLKQKNNNFEVYYF